MTLIVLAFGGFCGAKRATRFVSPFEPLKTLENKQKTLKRPRNFAARKQQGNETIKAKKDREWNSVLFCMALTMNSVEIPGGSRAPGFRETWGSQWAKAFLVYFFIPCFFLRRFPLGVRYVQKSFFFLAFYQKTRKGRTG